MSDQEYPRWYNIEALLNTGPQPFDKWPKDELEQLAEAIGGGKRPLSDPVKVGRDGTLLDGHQRLKAMQMAGRTRIYAGDVRVVEAADTHNAMDYAVELNVGRRHLTTEQKQKLALMLYQERGWSQVKIAAKMKVSQGRVSQWISAERADLEDAETTMVPDGSHPSEPAAGRPPRVPTPASSLPAWAVKGKAYKALTSTANSLKKLLGSEPIGPMDAFQANAIADTLNTIIDRATELQDALSRAQSQPVPQADDDEPEDTEDE